MGDKVLVEKKSRITILRMNEPDKLNSVTPELRVDLKAALIQFRDDPESRVALLTGQGRAFCAGGDLPELEAGMTAVRAVRHMIECNELILLIAEIPKPIIAVVNGAAAGAGFSFAMTCDLIVASTTASFIQAFTKVGLVPDMSSIYFLPRVVGMHRAKELIWTGRKVNAEEAFQLGIINRLVKPEELEPTAMALAEQIAEGPPFAVGLGKTLLARSLENSLRDMLQYEGLAQPICLQSDDNKEGIQAFHEKRKPVFKGK